VKLLIRGLLHLTIGAVSYLGLATTFHYETVVMCQGFPCPALAPSVSLGGLRDLSLTACLAAKEISKSNSHGGP
jgi:hypothetical protein